MYHGSIWNCFKRFWFYANLRRSIFWCFFKCPKAVFPYVFSGSSIFYCGLLFIFGTAIGLYSINNNGRNQNSNIVFPPTSLKSCFFLFSALILVIFLVLPDVLVLLNNFNINMQQRATGTHFPLDKNKKRYHVVFYQIWYTQKKWSPVNFKKIKLYDAKDKFPQSKFIIFLNPSFYSALDNSETYIYTLIQVFIYILAQIGKCLWEVQEGQWRP